MGISLNLPDMNIREDEINLLLAIKLLEEGTVSLGKAAEIANYSEKAFVEVLDSSSEHTRRLVEKELCSPVHKGVDLERSFKLVRAIKGHDSSKALILGSLTRAAEKSLATPAESPK